MSENRKNVISVVVLPDGKKVAVMANPSLKNLEEASSRWCTDDFDVFLVEEHFLQEVTAAAKAAVEEGDPEGGSAGFALQYLVSLVHGRYKK